MKLLLVIFFIITISIDCLSQSFSSFAVIVIEDNTGLPISNAFLIIKEAGWASKTTGSDGKVFFDKSIPVGEIHYIISKEGYQGIEGTFNITTVEKDNSLKIKLSKFRDDRVLIIGEIVDENNQDLEGVIVEVRMADIIKTTNTDASGNYKIELEVDKTRFDVNSIRFEVKCSNNSVKLTEVIPLSRTNTIYKDFKIACLQAPIKSENNVYASFQLGLIPFSMVASRQQGQTRKYNEQKKQFIELCKRFNFTLRYDGEDLNPEFIVTTVFSNLTSFMTLGTEREIKEAFLLTRNFDEILITWFFKEEEFKEQNFIPMIENYEKLLKDNIVLSKELNEEGLKILQEDFRANIRKGYQARILNYQNFYNWMYTKVNDYLIFK